MVNVRAIDLNLLAVLATVLEERHITRAAKRLAMSQPAVSNALERARALLGDPLLKRQGRAMVLTARAQALRPQLTDAIAQLTRLVEAEPIELMAIERQVRIIMPEIFVAHLLCEIAPQLAAKAPGLVPVIMRWQSGDDASAALERGTADLAISGAAGDVPPETIAARPLGSQGQVLAMRRGHPAGSAPDLAQWLAWPHVVVSTQGRARTAIDTSLDAQGLTRRVGLVVPDFAMALDAVRHTDFLAQVPEGVARIYGEGVAFGAAPMPQAPLTLRLLRHKRTHRDLAVDFMAEQIARVFSGLIGQDASE